MAQTSLPGTGLLKGLAVTVKHLFKRPATLMYPYERNELAPRTRGVIALMDENCTVCMLCARECPDWCIYIDSHKETVPPAKEGGRARTRNVLDRFAIDFSLCMYCGICVEVCPFDALWWSPEFEYSEYTMDALLHEKDKLREWADTVPPPPALDEGAEAPAEVTEAIAKAEKELEAAAQKEADKAAAAEAATTEAKAGGSGPKKADEPKVAAGEIDQETYDALIAEGKSERIARSKAKAAYVKKEKARLKAEADAGGGDAEAAPTPKAADIKVEAGQIDQETYDALIAEGKTERMARAKAKAAWVKKEKARLAAEAESAAGAGAPAGEEAEPPSPTDAAGSDQAPSTDAPAEEPAATRKLGDVHVEGTGEIDQETYDALIAEGKSERIARAKAKAAWVKKAKQAKLDEEGGA
ncbi:MAG: NADH-quinone oxidoreductase subunit I [Nitriliruptoraceae bacterium]|nr:NADH-quinone oxidoreductase subunit I [Nitriliruptoraceae bacterium]